MSMPSIPNLNPQITIQRDDALNLIISSIGMEELSLAHLMNAEAEKIQYALGTLETADGAGTMDEIFKTNQMANKMLRDVIKNQMLMAMKMEDTVELALATTTEETVPEETTPEETTPEETKEEAAQEEAVKEEAPAEEAVKEEEAVREEEPVAEA